MSTSSNTISSRILAQLWYKFGMKLWGLISKGMANNRVPKYSHHQVTYTFMGHYWTCCTNNDLVMLHVHHLMSTSWNSISSRILVQLWYKLGMILLRLISKGTVNNRVSKYSHHWVTYTFMGHYWKCFTNNDSMILHVHHLMSTSSNTISPWILEQLWYKFGMKQWRLISKDMAKNHIQKHSHHRVTYTFMSHYWCWCTNND